MARDGRLLNRNFSLLWQGQLVSLIGSQVFALALLVWLKQATESATLLGLLMATFVVPGLFMGPFGGVLVDRYPRRLVLVVCDLVRGVAVLSLGILLLIVPASHPLSISGLFVLALIVGSTTAVFQPAVVAFIPELVSREGLPRANSLIQSSFQIGALIGQSLAGVSFRLIGAPVLALVDAATYLYSAASALVIKVSPAPRPPVAPSRAGRPSLGGELRAGMRYVRSTTGLWVLLLMSAGLKFFVAPFTVLLAFYVEEHLSASPDWYGFLVAGMGLGMIGGFVISGAVKLRPRQSGTAIAVAIVAQSLTMTSLALATTPLAALALFTLAGMMNGFINVRFTTLLQLAVSPDMRGRVFGLLRTVTEALIPIATILAGIVADLTGRNVPLVYAGCGIALTCISLALAASRSCRAFLAGDIAPPAPSVRTDAPAEPAVTAGIGG